MHSVQIVISDSGRAREIGRYLTAKTHFRVRRSPAPSPRSHQVLLMDEPTFRAAISRLAHPERIVLLASQPNEVWDEAMRAGVVSVVKEEDSLETLLMAVLCADLRLSRHAGCPHYCANIPRSLCPLRIAPQEVDWNRGRRDGGKPGAAWPQSCTWKM